jgi:hypothetical protein
MSFGVGIAGAVKIEHPGDIDLNFGMHYMIVGYGAIKCCESLSSDGYRANDT